MGDPSPTQRGGEAGDLAAHDLNLTGIAVAEKAVYAGGGFTNIGGQPRFRIAALDPVTGAATRWDPGTDALSGSINALAVDGGILYAGGVYTSIGGQERWCVAAIDRVSGKATDWLANANNAVRALSVNGGTVYVGGEFRSIGSWPRSYIAAVSAQATTAVAPPPLEDRLQLRVFPNPFSSVSTTIGFTLSRTADVDLGIYDLSGRLVRGLEQGRFAAGPQQFDWDGRDRHADEVAPGIYFLRLSSGATSAATKVVKLR